MTAQILDGKAFAKKIKEDLAVEVTALKARGITPGLGTILVGDDPGSRQYVGGKHKDCSEVGVNSIRIDLPGTATQADVLAAVKDMNNNPDCTGYIVQLPLPKDVNTQAILEAIDPEKDADGLHPMNLGRLTAGFDGTLPCTPRGIVELLHHYKIPVKGAEVTIVGRGLTVGRPLSLLLNRREENATVNLVHTGTKVIKDHTLTADIIVVAVGVGHFLTPDMVSPGAVVIDVGVSRNENGIQGDVHPDVANVAGWISPNPGGVGPLTRAMLVKTLWILQLDNLETPDNLHIQMISQRLLNFAAAIGVLLGAIGLVRTGAIVVGAAIALTGVRQERRIERYLPLAIGVALIAVAIVLPHGR